MGPAPMQPYHENLVHYNWHWFWDFGNGELGNNGIHMIDILRWGNAEEAAGARACDRRPFRLQGPGTDTQHAERHLDVRRRLDDRRPAARAVYAGADVLGFLRHQGAHAHDGRRPIPDHDGPQQDSPSRRRNSRRISTISRISPMPFARETAKLLHAEIEETYLSTALCHLGNISYRVNRDLRFDPSRMQFTGDAGSEQAADAGISEALRRAGQSVSG